MDAKIWLAYQNNLPEFLFKIHTYLSIYFNFCGTFIKISDALHIASKVAAYENLCSGKKI